MSWEGTFSVKSLTTFFLSSLSGKKTFFGPVVHEERRGPRLLIADC